MDGERLDPVDEEEGVPNWIRRAVQNQCWRSVHWALRNDQMTDRQAQCTLTLILETVDTYTFTTLVGHFPARHLDFLLTQLVVRQNWECVDKALQRGVSADKLRWAVDEASTTADDNDFRRFVIHHCPTDMLQAVVLRMMDRKLWQGIGDLLFRGVSDSIMVTIFKKAVLKPYQSELIYHLLLRCDHDKVRQILLDLRRDGVWDCATFEHESEDALQIWLLQVVQSGAKVYSLWLPPFLDNGKAHLVLKPLLAHRDWSQSAYVIHEVVIDALFEWSTDACDKLRSNTPADTDIPGYFGFLDEKGNSYHVCCSQNSKTVGPVNQAVGPHTETTTSAASVVNIKNISVESCVGTENVAQTERAKDSACTEQHRENYAPNASTRTQRVDVILWNILHTCRLDPSDTYTLCKTVREHWNWKWDKCRLQVNLKWNKHICETLFTVLSQTLCSLLRVKPPRKYIDGLNDSSLMTNEVKCLFSRLQQELVTYIRHSSKATDNQGKDTLANIIHLSLKIKDAVQDGEAALLLAISLLQSVVKQHHQMRQDESDDEALMVVLCTAPLVPFSQDIALKKAMEKNHWHVIGKACLSHASSQTRLALFTAAVQQRQWTVVALLADHALTNVLREWALAVTLDHQQWQLSQRLAFHAPLSARLNACCTIALKADWTSVLQLLDQDVCISTVNQHLHDWDQTTAGYLQRQKALKNLESKYATSCPQLDEAIKVCSWGAVVFRCNLEPLKDSVLVAVHAAVEQKAWSAVSLLVRLGVDADLPDSLFPTMVVQKQWSICSLLLDQGVSPGVALAHLSYLIELHQWGLVAKMMRLSISDDIRKNALQVAMDEQEGTAVEQIIRELETGFSREERDVLFRQALAYDIWPAMKPLLTEKDSMGNHHRSMALQEAVKCYQWDLVDHCLAHGADIGEKDEQGFTLLVRMIRGNIRPDWVAIKELLIRGADPSITDSRRQPLVQLAIKKRQWEVVKVLISSHADIYCPDHLGHTPLSTLITKANMDMIVFAINHCPDMSRAVAKNGHTLLHAACQSHRPDLFQCLIKHGADPLAVTNTGMSVLMVATMNRTYSQSLVNECVRLGISTHHYKIKTHKTIQNRLFPSLRPGTAIPFATALYFNNVDLCELLYHSGCCSYRHIFAIQQYYERTRETDYSINREQSLLFLKEVASNPRSLASTCRLLIARLISVYGDREKNVQQLPLTQRMKNFIMFSDLTSRS